MTLNPNAIDLAIAEILAKDPDRNVRRGSGTRTFIIDPWALMHQPLVDESILLRNRLTIDRLSEMSEEAADELVANMAIERRAGSKARGVMRLTFAEPVSALISEAMRFRSLSGEEFAPLTSRQVTAAEMRLNRDDEHYYIDIAAIAVESGASGNAPAGTVTRSVDGPSSLSFVTNLESFVGETIRETNAQLQQRIPDAIANRSVVSKPGIRTVILEQFPEISHSVVIGKGDSEMERDVVTGTDLTVGGHAVGSAVTSHVGGHVDIYIRTLGHLDQAVTLIFASGDVRPILVFGRTAAADDEVEVTFTPPFLGITSIELADPSTGVCSGVYLEQGVDFTVTPETPPESFSDSAIWTVELLESGSHYDEIVSDPGKSLIVTYLMNPDIATVQAYVDEEEVQNLCSSTVVKATVPVFIDVDVTYKPKPPEALTENETEATGTVVQDAIRAFLLRVENLDGFNIDDLYRMLYSLPIERVNKPVSVRMSMMDRAGVVSALPLEDDYLTLWRGSAASLPDSTRVALPGESFRYIGVGVGDTLYMAWTEGGVLKEDTREIVNVERALPEDEELSVIVTSDALPELNTTVVLEIRRSTVGNVAAVPRIGGILPGTVRALPLAV